MNEIFLTFDYIKEDIENTTIFIHEKGLQEDITNYLSTKVVGKITNGFLSDLEDKPFKEMSPLELGEIKLD